MNTYQIWLNGDEQAIPAESSVSALLDQLQVPRLGVAIAINGHVIPKGQHDSTPIPEGARVEIIRAVGGG
jgi:sulfur carrier protein